VLEYDGPTIEYGPWQDVVTEQTARTTERNAVIEVSMTIPQAMRWHNEDTLPEDVRASMRDLLAEALREAARTEDPGDGSMTFLSPEKVIGNGMWDDNGWKLQSSFVQDARMNEAPFVAIHAYQGSCMAKGSVQADVVRTPYDRRYIANQRLERMIRRREALDADIKTLTAELDGASL
jgi:hypothetical protein